MLGEGVVLGNLVSSKGLKRRERLLNATCRSRPSRLREKAALSSVRPVHEAHISLS